MSQPAFIKLDTSNQIAYTNTYGGTGIIFAIDISDPSNMSILGSFGYYQSLDLELDNSTAYVLGSDSRISTYDVSNPSNMTLINTAYNSEFSGRYLALDKENSVAYTAGRELNYLTAIDISNPSSLVKISSHYLPKTQGLALDLTNNVAYVGRNYSFYGILAAVNIADPSSMSTISDQILSYSRGITPSKLWINTTSEILYIAHLPYPSILISVDVSDQNNKTVLQELTISSSFNYPAVAIDA